MSRPTKISCDDAIRHLFAYLDGELESDRHADVEHHLAECRACCSRADFELLLKERVTELGKEQAPAALRRRIRALLDSF